MNSNELPDYSSRLEAVQERITAAAKKAARSPEEITLIVVSKFHPAHTVRQLYDLGVRNFGENRHQEAELKAEETADLDINWHFVGQLQSKKARAAAKYAKTIHSLDRTSVINALAKFDGKLDGFLQINMTPDRGRGGVEPEDIAMMAELILGTETINLKGVMAVAPLDEDPLRAFERLAGYSQEVLKLAPEANAISAGMTHDFEEAIQFGATHLRIGSAITGERPKTG